jgi:aminoglycoside N3'-acetyltransferase
VIASAVIPTVIGTTVIPTFIAQRCYSPVFSSRKTEEEMAKA